MFELCRKKYYHIKVAKDAKDADSDEANEGKNIHKALFARVVKGKPLPLVYRYMEKMAKKFADKKGEKHGELQFALNSEFVPCGWFDKETYVRAIIDLLIINGTHALVVDWKTGKVRPDFDQLKLSAAVLSKQMPELKTFTLAYVWVNQNDVSVIKMGVEHMTEVWADVLPRANEIVEALKTTDFPAEPNHLCKRYCPVTQCPHHGT